MRLEHIGIALLGSLSGISLVVDVAGILYGTLEHRYLQRSVESEVAEVVLHHACADVVHGERESADGSLFASGIVDGVDHLAVDGDARLVDKHVVELHLHALVAVAHLDVGRELHGQLLHVETAPGGLVAVGDARLVFLVVGGECAHGLLVLRKRVVDDHILCREHIARKVCMLKRVEVGRRVPVVPALYGGLHVQLHGIVGALAVADLLQVVGHGHVEVHVQSLKLVVAPRHEATVVFGLHHVLRSLELDHETRLRVLHLKVFEQRHRSRLGNEAAGADAQARRAKDQYLVVRGLGLGHHEGSDEIHRGVGGRKLHGGDLEVDRCGVELLGYLQREGDVLHIALEQTKHLGLAVHHLLIIFGKVVFLGQALDLVLRGTLKLVGIRYARVADEVVDAPVGEQLVHDLRTGHRVVAAIGDHQALVDLVLGVDADGIELHRELPGQRQRFPDHVSRAGELAVAHILQLAVEHEVVLANGHRLALQLVGLPGGGSLVVDDYLVGTLEITFGVFLGQRKVDGVDAVVEIVDRGHVERARLDAQQYIVALRHLVLELCPTQGVGSLLHTFHRIDRLLQEHRVARGVGVSAIHLDVVDKLDAVGCFATSALELRLAPLHGYVAFDKLLACSVLVEVARQHNLGVDEIVERVGELLLVGFLVGHETHQGRHRPSVVAEEIPYGALFRRGIRNGIYAHHVDVVRTDFVEKALG